MGPVAGRGGDVAANSGTAMTALPSISEQMARTLRVRH